LRSICSVVGQLLRYGHWKVWVAKLDFPLWSQAHINTSEIHFIPLRFFLAGLRFCLLSIRG